MAVSTYQPIDYTNAIIIEQRQPYLESSKKDSVLNYTIEKNQNIVIAPSSSNRIEEYPNKWLQFKDNTWIIQMFLEAEKIVDTQTLVPYYKQLHSLLLNKKFNTCNSILAQVNLTKSSEVLLVGILRLTYTWNNNLPEWKNLLTKVEKELIKRDLNTKRVLIGLI